MGKPRRKGMKRGYLKRFSSQAINKGTYEPHKPTLAEYARRPRSMGYVDPKSGHVTHLQAIPPTLGATQPIKERVKTWELYARNERHQIKLSDAVQLPKMLSNVPLPIAGHELYVIRDMWIWVRGGQQSVTYSSQYLAEFAFWNKKIKWLNSE